MATPSILIWIEEETLSDQSKVYNVVLPGEKLSAVSSADADELALKIVDAINDHTSDIADVMA